MLVRVAGQRRAAAAVHADLALRAAKSRGPAEGTVHAAVRGWHECVGAGGAMEGA